MVKFTKFALILVLLASLALTACQVVVPAAPAQPEAAGQAEPAQEEAAPCRSGRRCHICLRRPRRYNPSYRIREVIYPSANRKPS